MISLFFYLTISKQKWALLRFRKVLQAHWSDFYLSSLGRVVISFPCKPVDTISIWWVFPMVIKTVQIGAMTTAIPPGSFIVAAQLLDEPSLSRSLVENALPRWPEKESPAVPKKKHENFNIAVKKYNPTLDEAQLEGRVDRLSENNYNGLVLRMHGYDDKKKGPLQF